VSPLYLFPEKPGDLFLLIAVAITIGFYCVHSGVTPSRVSPTPFYLSDLVSPLFFVNLPRNFFSFECHPPGGCNSGRSVLPRPPPIDATVSESHDFPVLFTLVSAVRAL